MFIHYLIILHGFVVILASINNRTSIIFIINNVKSRHQLSTVFISTSHNYHTNKLSQWFRHSSANIKIHLRLISSKDKSYKNFRTHSGLNHFINNIYNQFSNSYTKKDVHTPFILPEKLIQILFHKENQTKNLIKTNHGTTNRISSFSKNINRLVNTSDTSSHKNRRRIRRNFLRENTVHVEDDANIFSDGDRRDFNNQQANIAEQKRGFDEEYYRPIRTKYNMSKLSKKSVTLFRR